MCDNLKKMINTYNESKLHETLKKIYALESNGMMEVKLDDTPWICDILDENGNVIEIQTSNLSALTEKAEYILETGRKLKIVRKRSPKKAGIFDSLRGMTQICPLFLHENCELEILYCEITEMRRKTDSPSQNQSKTRRHLKEWVPLGKRLEKITRKERFCTKEDWEKLLPENLRKTDEEGTCPKFRACDLAKEITKEKGAKTARWTPLLIWLFVKMQILKITEIKGRSKFYSVSR